jgi:hypothetical protein
MVATKSRAVTPDTSLIAETAARLSVPPRRIRVALRAAQQLSDVELDVVDRFAAFAAGGASPARRGAVAAGLLRALAALGPTRAADPLATVDTPLDEAGAADATLQGELEVHARRRQLLQRCVSAADACLRTGRSRQALERLRRDGRVLALRAGNQWRYPEWQFERDAPGGIVPGLAEVLARLHLSPIGTAFWLLQPSAALAARTPIDALHRGQREAVLQLAIEQGYLP